MMGSELMLPLRNETGNYDEYIIIHHKISAPNCLTATKKKKI